MTSITFEEACKALDEGKYLRAKSSFNNRSGIIFRASRFIKEGRSFDELELLCSGNEWRPIDVDSKSAIKHRMEIGYEFQIVEPGVSQ